MKKIILLLISLMGIFAGFLLWNHYHSQYIILFLMPSEDKNSEQKDSLLHLFRGIEASLNLGIEDAQAKNKFIYISYAIPEPIEESLPVIESHTNKFIKDHPEWLWDDKKIIIFTGFSSAQLKAGHAVVKENNRKILCIGAMATSPYMVQWKNTLQIIHSDALAANAIGMYLRRKLISEAIILYKPQEPYSEGYYKSLEKALQKQDIKASGIPFTSNTIEQTVAKEVNPLIKNAQKTIIIFTWDKKDIMKAEKYLHPHTSILCTDLCADIGNVFPTDREVVVVVPSIIDYTIRCRSLYKRLFEIFESINVIFLNI